MTTQKRSTVTDDTTTQRPAPEFVNVSLRCHGCLAEDVRYWGSVEWATGIVADFFAKHVNCGTALFVKPPQGVSTP